MRKTTRFLLVWLTGLETEQQKIGLLSLFAAQHLGLLFDRAHGVLPTSGVNKLQMDIRIFDLPNQVITRRPRLRAHESRRTASQSIEKAALPGIRPANEHHAERPIADRPLFELLAKQFQLRRILSPSGATIHLVQQNGYLRLKNRVPLRDPPAG